MEYGTYTRENEETEDESIQLTDESIQLTDESVEFNEDIGRSRILATTDTID